MNKNLLEIINDNFKEDIMDISPINSGWLTEKWKIKYKNKTVMLKVIMPKKIQRRNLNIELASDLLHILNNNDVKCPKIYLINEKLVNYDENKNPFVIVDFYENTFSKNHTNITNEDIHSIGVELAKMRNIFDKIEFVQNIDFLEFKKKIYDDYNKRVKVGKKEKNLRYLNDVKKQERIIKSLSVTFFDKYKLGYCHCDLSQDNILFNQKGFMSIIDFDLANVSFVLRDIARVFLTFCLNEDGVVNKKLLKSLLDGFNSIANNKITLNDLVDGIKILWCLEVDLWIKEAYYVDETPKKVLKFINEINWITDNWQKLKEELK